MPFQHRTDSIIYSITSSVCLIVYLWLKHRVRYLLQSNFPGILLDTCFPLKSILLLENYSFIMFFPLTNVFLCKITVLAFLGMQLWSKSSLKNLKKEHQCFSSCYYITPEIKLLHLNECKFLLTSNTSLLLSLLCLGSWGHRVSPFFISVCQQSLQYLQGGPSLRHAVGAKRRIWWAASRFVHI